MENNRDLFGVWNIIKKEFQFGIKESSKNKATKKLISKIGKDAFKLRFEIRKIPENMKGVKEWVKDMDLNDAIVKEVIEEPEIFVGKGNFIGSFWLVKVKYEDISGFGEDTLLFSTKEAADKIKIGYVYQR